MSHGRHRYQRHVTDPVIKADVLEFASNLKIASSRGLGPEVPEPWWRQGGSGRRGDSGEETSAPGLPGQRLRLTGSRI